MANPNNKTMLAQTWSQLNDKKSWLFTHIANTILDTPIPVRNGTKDQKTTLRTEMAWNADNFKAVHGLNARFRPGINKVQTEGDIFGMLRRAESNTLAANATIQSMAGALAAVTKGEQFDEAKLLGSIQTMLDDQAKRVVEVRVDVAPSAVREPQEVVQGEEETK